MFYFLADFSNLVPLSIYTHSRTQLTKMTMHCADGRSPLPLHNWVIFFLNFLLINLNNGDSDDKRHFLISKSDN